MAGEEVKEAVIEAVETKTEAAEAETAEAVAVAAQTTVAAAESITALATTEAARANQNAAETIAENEGELAWLKGNQELMVNSLKKMEDRQTATESTILTGFQQLGEALTRLTQQPSKTELTEAQHLDPKSESQDDPKKTPAPEKKKPTRRWI